MKFMIVVEYWVVVFFNVRLGGFNKFMCFFVVWLVLFGFKFVIFELFVFVLGDCLCFSGFFYGIVVLIVVVVMMFVFEVVIVKFYCCMG